MAHWHPGRGPHLSPPEHIPHGKPHESGMSLAGWRKTTGDTVLKRTTTLSEKHSVSCTVISTWSCYQCTGHCCAHTPFNQLEVQPESFLCTCVTPSSNPLMTSCLPILNLKGLFLSLEESNFFPFCSIPAKTRDTVLIGATAQFKCWGWGEGRSEKLMSGSHQLLISIFTLKPHPKRKRQES